VGAHSRVPFQLLLGLCTAACSVPRAYQSPRTTPRGLISHSLAVEAGQGFFEQDEREEETLTAPEGHNPATYTIRVGLAERWEAAGSAGLGLWASEVKWNFLRTVPIDAAVAPRAQYYEPLVFDGEPRTLLTLSLPAPVGFNVSREFSIIATPALAYAAGRRPGTTDEDTTTTAPTMMERALVGALAVDLQLRPHSRLAFQPGVTMLRRFDNGEVRWQVGVAFNFGRLPFYGDVPP